MIQNQLTPENKEESKVDIVDLKVPNDLAEDRPLQVKPETPDFTKDMYLSKSGEFKGISSLTIGHEDNRNSKSTRPKSSSVI